MLPFALQQDSEDLRYLHQFIVHKAIDKVSEIQWESEKMYAIACRTPAHAAVFVPELYFAPCATPVMHPLAGATVD